jgi:hypothetical protein
MTEVRTSSLCERPCAGIEDTLEASIGIGGHQSVFDAAMAPTQESGLRENCTSRLSERAEAGRKLHLSRLYVCLTVDASGGLKSRSARGPEPISEGGGNASPAREDGRYGEASEAQRRKPGNG